MIIISHIVALAASALFLGCYFKNIRTHAGTLVKAKKDKRFDGFLQALKEEDMHFKHASWYFFITGLITAGAFYLINYLPKWITGGILADIISTGLHVIIILMVVSLLLKFSKLENEEKKKLLYLIALTISISFIFWDWKLGLTALCIVAGRDVWMDFLIDFKFSKVREHLHELRTGHSTEAIIGRYCVAYMIAFMCFQIIDLIVRITGKPQILTILICISIIAVFGLAMMDVTIFINSISKAQSKDKKQMN